MQDIDFDELDRAVASTMPSGEPQRSTPERSEGTVSAPRQNPPASRRSSGRFMDVVHPSSDMRSSSNQSAPKPEEPAAEKEASNYSPLESPFLPDAKVEKRPLGGEQSSTPDLMEEPETPLIEAPDEELLPATTESTEPEATPDSSTDMPDMPMELPDEEAPVEEKPAVEETPREPVAQPEPEQPALTPEPEMTGPTEITQQYKERPAAEQPSGAIYDTESYHQPLTHAPQKKSGVLIVLWIIALILVGAGAGAGVYFFVLPML